MRNAEILKGGQSADRRRNQVIGDEQKRTDDRDDLAAMTHARVNAAAVGVKTADDHVINADECGQYTHQRSEEHTSELQSQSNLVCRLLLEKKNTAQNAQHP